MARAVTMTSAKILGTNLAPTVALCWWIDYRLWAHIPKDAEFHDWNRTDTREKNIINDDATEPSIQFSIIWEKWELAFSRKCNFCYKSFSSRTPTPTPTPTHTHTLSLFLSHPLCLSLFPFCYKMFSSQTLSLSQCLSFSIPVCLSFCLLSLSLLLCLSAFQFHMHKEIEMKYFSVELCLRV